MYIKIDVHDREINTINKYLNIMNNTIFTVEHNGTTHNCYLNHLGEVWIKEVDGSQTSTKFERPITKIEDAKQAAIDMLKGLGR